MKEKIELGDVVKLNRSSELENIDRERIKFDYGIVMEVIHDTHVTIAPYSKEGKMIFRDHAGIVLPNRIHFNLKEVKLFLKGNEPDGFIKLKKDS